MINLVKQPVNRQIVISELQRLNGTLEPDSEHPSEYIEFLLGMAWMVKVEDPYYAKGREF
jgi:hypothetical protein